MAVVRLFVKVLDGREAERELRKLLKRHGDKILAVAVIMQASEKQVAAIIKHYDLRPVNIPAAILLKEQDSG